jgi:cytochrome c-type biogenesis protein CcmE
MISGRVIFGALIAVTALAAVMIGTWQASVPFISPGELTATHEGRRVQVEGIILEMRPIAGGVEFDLSDGEDFVLVSYPYGASRPLALEAGRIVVAKGVYRDGSLAAQQVSIRAHEADSTQPERGNPANE